MKPEEKNCGNSSCGCATTKDVTRDAQKDVSTKSIEKKPEEEKLDPTHFGDWQIGCRTIDF